MITETTNLTDTEQRIVTLLCEGLQQRSIGARLMIDVPTVRVHFSHIRVKLGLRDLSNLELLAKHAKKEKREATAAQWRVMAMYGEGRSYAEVCRVLEINIGTAMNHVCQGCKRLGITIKGKRRKASIRCALEWHWQDDPLFN